MKTKKSPPLKVKVLNLDELAPNIQDFLKDGCKLVKQVEESGMLYYIVESNRGIKVKLQAQNCEIVRSKKENKNG